MKQSNQQLHEQFQQMIQHRKERLLKAKKDGQEPSALMLYGQICGIADAMKVVGLIDYEQRDYIRNEAWALYMGKEPEYEVC